MRIPRLNRKQKIVRNLVLMVLALFLTAWMLDFPCWTQTRLLHRAERQNLIVPGTSQILCSRDGTLYAWTGDRILNVYYERTPLGFCLTNTKQEKVGEWYSLKCDRSGRRENLYSYPVFTLVGRLEAVASAELEVTASLPEGQFVGTYLIRGEREENNCFTFSLMRKTLPEKESLLAQQENQLFRGWFSGDSTTLRLYDADGKLIEERVYEEFP